MINTIVIASYIAVAVICAAVLAFYGYKKGWKGGLSIFGISVTATVCAYLLSHATADSVGELYLVTSLTEKGYTAAENIGISREELSKVLENAVDNVLEIPVAVALFVFFFAILAVTAFIIRKVMKCNKEQGGTASKITGLSLAAVSIPLVLLFTFLAGRINIFEETKRADVIMELLNTPEEQLAGEILHNNGVYTGIYFDTAITDADENTRLSLINNGINGAVGKVDDQLLTQLYNFEGYSSRAELNTDLTTIDELYIIACENDFFGEESILQKVFQIEDKKSVIDKIYSLKFRDILLRYILSYAVRSFVSDQSYIYPDTIPLEGTQDELLLLLDVAQKVKSEEISKVEAAKQLVKSPLVPKDVISIVIKENLGKIVGENLSGKVAEYIEKHDILEKIADSELPVEDITDFIDKLQDGYIAEEARVEELKELLESSGILDKIQQDSLGADINIDQDIIDAIKDNDFTDITIEDILSNIGNAE